VDVGKWVNLDRAAEGPDTAEIHVSFLLEVGGLEVAQHGDAIVVWVVVVPLEALGVDEEHYIGEVFVVIDNVPASQKKHHVSVHW
jgi:hypothetical protein